MRRFKHKLKPSIATKKKRTCLDCGFLTIQGRELDQTCRDGLFSKVEDGVTTVLPSHCEETICYRGLWTVGLDYREPCWDGVETELKRSRNNCAGFMPWEGGLSFAQYLEKQEVQRVEDHQERLQLKVAKLGFWGALLGGAVGAAVFMLIKWIIGNIGD